MLVRKARFIFNSPKFWVLFTVFTCPFILNLSCCRSGESTIEYQVNSIRYQAYNDDYEPIFDSVKNTELDLIWVNFSNYFPFAETNWNFIPQAMACSPADPIQIQRNTFRYLHFITLDTVPNFAVPGDTIDDFFMYSTSVFTENRSYFNKFGLDQKLSEPNTGLVNHQTIGIRPQYILDTCYTLHFEIHLGLDDSTLVTTEFEPLKLTR